MRGENPTKPYETLLRVEKLELELIRTHMAQKPMLRVKVGARALCVRCACGQCQKLVGLMDELLGILW